MTNPITPARASLARCIQAGKEDAGDWREAPERPKLPLLVEIAIAELQERAGRATR